MAAPEDALAALSPEQRAAFELLLRRGRPSVSAGTAIPRRADPAAHPLSFAQQRLWFLDQLAPGDPAYNIHGAVRLRGTLDAGALAGALSVIAARHEPLRARFAAAEGEPVQIVDPAAPVPLPLADLTAIPEHFRTPEVLRRAGEEARLPFDLARGPLLRALLLRAAPAEHVLLLTIHHVAADGWSIGVLLRELTTLYAALAADRPAPLPPLPLAYADFAAWQRERLQGARLAAEVEHWRARLAGLPAPRLTVEAPPAEEGSRGAAVSVSVAPPLTGRLQAIARRAGASLFMTLLAAFEIVLGRWSGERDFGVGTPVANRTRPELEGLIGFFVNTLVLRADLEGDPSFLDLLARVEKTVVDALAHQELPFEKLVEELHPERRLGRTPFFTAVLALQNLPAGAARLPGLEMEALPVRNGTARFDLTLSLAEEGGGLTGDLEYRRGVLPADAAGRMAGHLGVLLEAIAEDPLRPLSALPLLTAAERHQILVEWAGPERGGLSEGAEGPGESLSGMFQRQAQRTPGAVAVVCGAESITYGALDRRSNQLARRLRALGAGPETVVAICVERSLEMAVGLLGILKSGAAYLPIDPLNPRERQAFLLEDGGASILLTQARWVGELGLAAPPRVERHILRLDQDWPDIARETDAPLPPLGGPDNAIALLYTSGSTGRPKATVLEGRGFLNLCLWFRDVCPIGASTRSLLGFAFSFDAAFKNILVPLLVGGRTVLPPPGPYDAGERLDALRREGVTFLNTTPSQMVPILQRAAPERWRGLESLRTLILGGEAARWEELRPWLASGRCGAEILHMYGPSEVSDTVSCHRATPEEIAAGGRLPVGRAADNTRMMVVDADLRLLPAGVAGELCLAGIGLARGYLARPELTAERFVPDPWRAGGRMYRTGDVARWRPDGALEILGRIDHQIKIRGIRVEPSEVEAVLAAHPAVGGAVVGARENAAGEKRLIAWLVPVAGGELPPPGALRLALRERLPDVMIPESFVVLESFPLTPRGKIDRAALATPGRAAAGVPAAPADAVEDRLLDLFHEVLDVERVGPDDNFFELGGHSMSAFRLVTRIREVFGLRLAVRNLFTTPTPAGLAEVLRGMEQEESALPPVHPVPRDRPLPLSLAQQRLWLLHQLTPGLTTYHIPAGLRLRGRLDLPALAGALSAILRRHEALRTHFPVQDGEPVQEIDPAADARLPGVDLAALPAGAREGEARRIVLAEALRPFDLERGPLLRLLLLRLGAEDHVLAVVVHHLVSDGWSAALFLRELSVLYTAAVNGAPSPLPEPPVQYADWAVWQREELHGAALDELLAWWTGRLAGAPRRLDFPTDHPRPPVEDPAGAGVPLHLPEPVVEALRRLALGEAATLYMALLAGFQALLARLAGQETVCVGSPVARRHRLEVEGLIGFFVNTVVLRADVTAELTGRALVARVREAVFGAFAHQDLPFERLVEALDPRHEPGWSPLFQASFALQNVPREEPRLPGLAVELLETDTGTAHFDLAMALVETEDGAAGSLRYRTALFREPTMLRLAGHYEAFLTALAAEPDRPVAALSFLSEAERHQILIEWAGAERELPEKSLPELFQEQAARTPEAIAVVCGADSITYADLRRRSGDLAAWLRAQGAGPETVVAISLERSIEMVAGLLGILEAGAAYLPVDPRNPRERQAFQVEDGGAAIVLTAPLPRGREGAPSPAPRGRDGVGGKTALAALLYTSGSTGRPKATALTARGLLNLCLWHRDASPVLPSTRSLLGFSFSFDAAFKHLIVPLLVGGRVVLAPPGPFDAEEMLEAIRREEVDFFATTSSQMVAVLQRAAVDGFRRLETLRTVIVGGEATPWADFRPWLASGRCHAEILHTYGPSEVSDTVAGHRATPEEILTSGHLPVGRAVDNLRLLVVDAGLEPLPVGTPGELCLAGLGVARGYFGRPALTAEKFVPDPVHPGERMYRTGDRARWRTDGEMEILGRIDHQVKIRGIRVEPPEVEAALAAHPAVGGAVVGAREGAAGEKRLLAWLVPAEGAELPSTAELREHLRERLPEALIPSAFVPLAAFPLTPRGKLDRGALPDPGEHRDARTAAPPRDAVELRLAGLFAEVLGILEVGIRDSFFDLGGHSLAAVRLASRVREVFGTALPVATLFAAPTVEALAALLRESGGITPSPLVPLRTAGDRVPLFLVHPGGGSVFGYLDLVRRLEPGRPVFGLQAPGIEAGEEPLGSVEALAERYLGEIRRVQEKGPWHLAGWSFGGLVAFEMARRLRAAGDEVAQLTLIDPTDPADLSDRTDPGDPALREAFARELALQGAGDLAPADLDRRFAVFRANAEAARAFRPGPYDGPLDLIEAAGRPVPAVTWRALARRVAVLPGDHYSLLAPPQVEALAAALAGVYQASS